MRIGILTQHFLLNYGGIIQNYALQQVLIRLGHHPLTFEHDTCYSHFRWILRVVKHVAKERNLKDLPSKPVYKGRIGQRNFIHFVLRNIRSVKVRNFSPNLTRRYQIEAYIVGSDQVWRPAFNLEPRLYNMFLDFAGSKPLKIAYAASFGTSDWEFTAEQTRRCRALASEFNAISVRESTGVELCKKYLGVNAEHVLDPTFLLQKEDYLMLCMDIPRQSGHVFAYSLVQRQKVAEVAKRVAAVWHEPVIHKEAGSRVKAEDSIEAWLAEFRDATSVVTDSFHGMVFSILFHKPFLIVMNPSGGNDRYLSLLNDLGLSDRILSNGALPEKVLPIDWNVVDARLEEQRSASIDFLKRSLS